MSAGGRRSSRPVGPLPRHACAASLEMKLTIPVGRYFFLWCSRLRYAVRALQRKSRICPAMTRRSSTNPRVASGGLLGLLVASICLGLHVEARHSLTGTRRSVPEHEEGRVA